MKKIAFALFLLFICFAFALAEPAEDITKQAKFTVSGLVSPSGVVSQVLPD